LSPGATVAAVDAGLDEADVAPHPAGVVDLGVVEEALGLGGAVAGDEGGALLLGEAVAHLLGDPFVDVDGGVVEQRGGRRRHGVELHGRERHLRERGERGAVGFGPSRGLGDPARLGAGDGEGLAVDGARHLADAGDGADGGDILHGAVDGALEFVGDEIAAVGAGADGEGLGLEAAQGGVLAVAHVGLEGGLVLEGGAGAQRRAGEVRPGRLEGELVDDAFVLIEDAVDAVDLVGCDDVGGEAALELAEALVVGVLEVLEGAHEAVEGGGEVAAGGGFGFEHGRGSFLVRG
jgi:hypothetical protein